VPFPAISIYDLASLLYLGWPSLPSACRLLAWLALIHTAAAYASVVLSIAHNYLLIAGH
jgi:hypothetical protein